jgi:hypothetical protein
MDFRILKQFLPFKRIRQLKKKNKSAIGLVLACEPSSNGPHSLFGPVAPLPSPAHWPGRSNAGPRWQPSRPEAIGGEVAN